MGSVKNQKEKQSDEKTTVRLGDPGKTILRVVAEREERTITSVLQRALRFYAEKAGINWEDCVKT